MFQGPPVCRRFQCLLSVPEILSCNRLAVFVAIVASKSRKEALYAVRRRKKGCPVCVDALWDGVSLVATRVVSISNTRPCRAVGRDGSEIGCARIRRVTCKAWRVGSPF